MNRQSDELAKQRDKDYEEWVKRVAKEWTGWAIYPVEYIGKGPE
jgi:hypothetical protein